MKVTANELRDIIGDMVAEAKGKKKSKERKAAGGPGKGVEPSGFSYADALDFSAPLGPNNLYRRQGGSAWGPLTSAGTALTDNELEPKDVNEAAVRALVRHVISEGRTGRNIWEQAMHWYDHAQRGLGTGRMSEKHVGFKALKGKLAHEKGVEDPAALAASIGRKKLGSKEMARRTSKGRRK